MNNEVDVIMDELFGEDFEFWKSDTETTIREAASQLLEEGNSVQEIVSFMGGIIGAIREEYGE